MARSVGIDIGSSAIKVVAGRARGPAFEMERAFTIPVDRSRGVEEGVLEALASLKGELGKAAGSRFSVSGRELIIRYTKVPPVPLWRLRLLMDFEVREMSEQAGEALASDYNLIHQAGGDDGEETLLVAVVKEPFLRARHRAIAEAVGEPKAAMPGSIALFNAYLQAGDLHEGEFVFLVDLGDENVEMALERDGDLLFARNISAGGRLLTAGIVQGLRLGEEDAERAKESLGNVTPRHLASYTSGREEQIANALAGPMGQLASMIQSSLAFARAQAGIKDFQLGRVLISGGTANLKGLSEYLKNTFKCPVERFEPESGLHLDGLGDEERAEFASDPGRYAVALGLAAGDGKEDAFLLDLVPREVKKRRHLATRTVWTIAAAVVAVTILGLRYTSLSSEAENARRSARAAQADAARTRRVMSEYADLQRAMEESSARIQELEALTRPAYTAARGLRLLQENAPEAIWVEDLRFVSQLAPVDPRDPSKGRRLNEFITVSGQVMSRDTTARAALEEWSRGVERAGEGTEVQHRAVGDVRSGSADTRFTMDVRVIGGRERAGGGEQQ